VGLLPDDVASRVSALLRESGCWFALISSPLAPLNPANAALASLCLRRIELQPLRYRQEEFTQIVNTVLRQLAPQRTVRLDGPTWDALRSHDWPGNYRELTDVLRHALTANPLRALRPEDLPESHRWPAAKHRLSPLEQVERDTILRVLHENQGNKTRTAQALGIGRATLYRRLRELAIA
jgi:transcriptional regulator of acetoin/glycerol metabolism